MEHSTPLILLLLLLLIGPPLFCIRMAKKGRPIYVRRIPGIDAIDEAVGRSVELGRPLSFTCGLTGISPLLYACLGALRYVARKAARYKIRLFVPASDSEALVLTDATLQNAFRSEKRLSSYDASNIRFLSDEQFAYASGYQGLIHRENVGAAFLFGRFAAESLILAEAGQQVGAIQVAATVSPEQVPFFLTTCDYTVIGEELFAAGAYLSGDPVQIGSLRGQDIAKCVIAVLILFGIIQATASAMLNGKAETPVQKWILAPWSEVFGSDETPAVKPESPTA